MPKLSQISVESYDWYKFKEIDWWSEAINQKGLAKGGVYLLSGAEGVGKSTSPLEFF